MVTQYTTAVVDVPFEVTKACAAFFEKQYNHAPPGQSLRQVRLDRLSKLRLNTPLSECGSMDQAPSAQVIAFKKHINRHWLGLPVDATTGVPTGPQPAHSPGSTTGWWVNWYGDADGILRESLIRSLEVSLGLDHGASEPAAGNAWRLWPIAIAWVSGTSRFQSFVNWADYGEAGAVVMLTWVTPAMRQSSGEPFTYLRTVTASPPTEIDGAVTMDAAGFLVVSKSLDPDEPVTGSTDVITIQDGQPVAAQLMGPGEGGLDPNQTPGDMYSP